jgi:hypothetical protein
MAMKMKTTETENGASMILSSQLQWVIDNYLKSRGIIVDDIPPEPTLGYTTVLTARPGAGTIDQRIELAIAAERERCAKIADAVADDPHGSIPACATAEYIAACIREGDIPCGSR